MIRLPPRRERFCQEYLIDSNGTQAAIRAGYSEKGARSEAARLLAFVNVTLRLQELREELAETFRVTRERVVSELSRLAFSDIRSVVKIDDEGRVIVSPSEDWAKDAARSVSAIEATANGVRVKMIDKKAALDSLARFLGMYVERKELSGPAGAPIETKFIVEFVDGENTTAS